MNREDRDPVGLDPIEDRVGESLEAGMSRVLVERGVDFGVPLDQVEGRLERVEELFTQAGTLPFVPGVGSVDLVTGSRLEDERQVHRGRLT
jgi:hypothetical protein